jgi:hypothetical protein
MMPIERRVRQIPVAVERRRRGRPPLVEGQRANDVTVRLTAELEDGAILIATNDARYNGSVSAVIRAALTQFLQAEAGRSQIS